MPVLIAITLFLWVLLGGDIQAQTKHLGEEECKRFETAKPPEGVLLFTGVSEFYRDEARAKLQALQQAQLQMAASFRSRVNSSCAESLKTNTTEKATKTHSVYECNTQVEVINEVVGNLGSQAEFCVETKEFNLGGKKNLAYRYHSRVEIPEQAFTQPSSSL